MKRILFTTAMLLLVGAGCMPSATQVPPNEVVTSAVGSNCGARDKCPPGLSCITYNGVAGNEFKSCEIPCKGDGDCPGGLLCASVSDGPGQVCVPRPVQSPTTNGIGSVCGTNDRCNTGQVCVKYFGIAGPSGPEFKSCEIQCKKDGDCLGGFTCASISDGPGQVCRPPAPKPVSTSGLGSVCGPQFRCGVGQTCLQYYGIAGPSGPLFTSCEIPCEGKAVCPVGLTCVSIADGPGQVCR